MKRKILLILVVLLILIQFIRPERNSSGTISPNDIASKYTVPDSVMNILKVSCYDCHSNHTTYPWYSNIQPVGWWMQKHVNDGKRHANYAEFGSYNAKRQAHVLHDTMEQLKRSEMPLNSYLWIHTDASLNETQKQTLILWADSLRRLIVQANHLPLQEEEEEHGEHDEHR
ncbi:MAG: heme-binding domain-containing protein [Chitinophagales bacterium]